MITAAARGVRLYPVADTVQKSMLPLVDRDGLTKPVIQIIAEEALDSGIEEICIVCAPGDEARYQAQLARLRENLMGVFSGVEWAEAQAARLDRLRDCLSFAVQEEPMGYGHAVHCAKEFVGDESFLLMLSDHLYLSHVPGKRCAEQLIDLAGRKQCAVAAVHATREHLVRNYGTVSGRRVGEETGIYEIEKALEKPSLSTAELELQTPGLRAGHYLCFFGMHVLPHRIFGLIEEAMGNQDAGGGIQLTPALQALADRERYLAAELLGERRDIGEPFGLLQAQLALGLAGQQRDIMLATILERMAEHQRTHGAGNGL